MQTENVYLKAYSKVIGEDFDPTSNNLKEFYESQLSSAGIPEDSLYDVYLQMREDFGSNLANLYYRQEKAREDLLAARTPEHYKKKLEDCINLNRLDCLSASIVAFIIAMVVVSHAFFGITITETLASTEILKMTILAALPAAFVAYLLCRIVTVELVSRKSTKLYEAERTELEQNYQEIEEEYRNVATMLEVIENACNDKPKPQAI
ncbi:hypothetical protein IJH19_00750 [Candidatus Saccharibacteria bacterium]|nr:hypothetical protein [Candidatus Saccharibacteria bacterium]